MSLIRSLGIVLSSNEDGAITGLSLTLPLLALPKTCREQGLWRGRAGRSQTLQRSLASGLLSPCSDHAHERDDGLRHPNLGLESL